MEKKYLFVSYRMSNELCTLEGDEMFVIDNEHKYTIRELREEIKNKFIDIVPKMSNITFTNIQTLDKDIAEMLYGV